MMNLCSWKSLIIQTLETKILKAQWEDTIAKGHVWEIYHLIQIVIWREEESLARKEGCEQTHPRP